MNSTRLIRNLFINGLIVLCTLLVVAEAVSWSVATEAKLNIVNQNGGTLSYLNLLVRRILLPETMMVFVLAMLMNWTCYGLKIRFVDSTWSALIRYQLIFLPTLLIAYVIFIPFTQSLRYLLIAFPIYSFDIYWHNYILGNYTFPMYFRYLFSVLFIGYSTLNISLATGFSRSRPSTAQ